MAVSLKPLRPAGSGPVHLGDKVRDVISGLTGIICSRTEFIYGCVRVGVQPQELKDGKPIESSHFDEPQLEVLECNHTAVPVPPQSGGVGSAVPRQPDIKR